MHTNDHPIYVMTPLKYKTKGKWRQKKRLNASN